MRDYRTREGERRLWYEDDEIERMMEAELRQAGLLPDADDVTVDVERFVERHLKAPLDQYAELEDGVLGETGFATDGSCEVRINRALTNAVDEEGCPPGVRGRWRATIAHEAAHILLHRLLFVEPPSQGLLFDTPARRGPRQVRRCEQRDVVFGAVGVGGDWREVQANKGMAALLMPRSLFCGVVRAALAKLPGAPNGVEAASPDHAVLAALLARRFAVSKQTAAIRLQTLGFVPQGGQGTLF